MFWTLGAHPVRKNSLRGSGQSRGVYYGKEDLRASGRQNRTPTSLGQLSGGPTARPGHDLGGTPVAVADLVIIEFKTR